MIWLLIGIIAGVLMVDLVDGQLYTGSAVVILFCLVLLSITKAVDERRKK